MATAGLESSIKDAPALSAGSQEMSGALPPLFMTARVLRGPLKTRESETILNHYNRLTGAGIPLDEYLHWVEKGPDGTAWHVLLENDDAQIVGHSALIPLRGHRREEKVVAGKAEYAFILEEYQTAKIRGLEKSGRPRNTLMIQQLFQGCGGAFDPLFISTLAESRRSLSGRSHSIVTFPVWECLLILRPWNAARYTPNLRGWQSAALGLAGVAQRTVWTVAPMVSRGKDAYPIVAMDSELSQHASDGPAAIRFFDDVESLSWRYPRGAYERLAVKDSAEEYLIFKRGAADRYLRVCQWRLERTEPSLALISRLVELALEQHAMGIRWATYGESQGSVAFVSRMRRFGFLCARRTRALVVHSSQTEFQSADSWELADSICSFDP